MREKLDMDNGASVSASFDAANNQDSIDGLSEIIAVAIIQKSLIQNILVTLFEKDVLTATETRLIVRSAGADLAAEVADRQDVDGDGQDAERIVEAGESYLTELEQTIFGTPDAALSSEIDPDAEDD